MSTQISREFKDFEGKSIVSVVNLPAEVAEGSDGHYFFPCPNRFEDQHANFKNYIEQTKRHVHKKLQLAANCTYYVFTNGADQSAIDLSGLENFTLQGGVDRDGAPSTTILFVAPTPRSGRNDILNLAGMAQVEGVAQMVPPYSHGFQIASGRRIAIRNIRVDYVAPIVRQNRIDWETTIPLHTFGTITQGDNSDPVAHKLVLNLPDNQYISPFIRKFVSVEDESQKVLFSRYNANEPIDVRFKRDSDLDDYRKNIVWTRDSRGALVVENPNPKGSLFNRFPLGARVRISHAPGSHAFNFESLDGKNLPADIALINVYIHSSPGVGVRMRMGSGLYISRLKIDADTRLDLSRRSTSVGSGGVVGNVKRNVIIEDSEIRHAIDDSLNLYAVTRVPTEIRRFAASSDTVDIFAPQLLDTSPELNDRYCLYQQNWSRRACGRLIAMDDAGEWIRLKGENGRPIANSILGAGELPSYFLTNEMQNGSQTYIANNAFENGNAGVVLKISNAIFKGNRFNQIAEGLCLYAKGTSATVGGSTIKNIVIENNSFRNVGASGEGGVIFTAGFMQKFTNQSTTPQLQSGPITDGFVNGVVPSRGFAYSTRVVQNIRIQGNVIYSAIVPPIWINNSDSVHISQNRVASSMQNFPSPGEDGVFLEQWNEADESKPSVKFWMDRREEIEEGLRRLNGIAPSRDSIRANHLTISGSCNILVEPGQSGVSDSAHQFRVFEHCQPQGVSK